MGQSTCYWKNVAMCQQASWESSGPAMGNDCHKETSGHLDIVPAESNAAFSNQQREANMHGLYLLIMQSSKTHHF